MNDQFDIQYPLVLFPVHCWSLGQFYLSAVPLHTGLVSEADEQLPLVCIHVPNVVLPHGPGLGIADPKVGQSQSLQGLRTKEGGQVCNILISEPWELQNNVQELNHNMHYWENFFNSFLIWSNGSLRIPS